jgi:hypothetical protein
MEVAVECCARHIFWMWSCSLLEEEGVGVPSGDAEEWLPPTPQRLEDMVTPILTQFPPPEGVNEMEWGQDMAHWLCGSGGDSGYHDVPEGLPSWEDKSFYLGDDGRVYLDDSTPWGDIPTLTGQHWLTEADVAHLRSELEQLWTGADAPKYVPLDTSLGRVFLHNDGRVERFRKILYQFE